MGLENMIIEIEKKRNFMFVSDTHYPFHDEKAVNMAVKVAKDTKPNYIVFGGDMIDAYIASKFGKDFSKISVQDELDGFIDEIYKPFLKASPKSKYIYLDGNHEARLSARAMDQHAFAKLRVLEYQNLLKDACDEANVPTMDYDDELLIKHRGKPIYLFKHGNKANKYSANSELELENISGMSGHIHRTDVRYKTNRTGTICWTNVGHLSDVKQQGYTKKNSNKQPNWNQGFGYLVKYGAHMYVEPIHITDDYTCKVAGKIYK